MTGLPGLILANRAYVDHDVPPSDGAIPSPGAGGLLAALHSVIEPWAGESGTTWIGASRGTFDREWSDASGYELIETPRGPLRHRRLFFAETTWHSHYDTVSNSFFWPLLHLSHERLPDLTEYYPRPFSPSAAEWRAYRRVNEAFAAAAFEEHLAGSCWIHDYHLALVPSILRSRHFPGNIGFFLHTPVPDLKIAGEYLDAAGTVFFREWLEGCLGADLVGFQTRENLDRFTVAAASLCGFAVVADGLRRGERTVRTGVFPVGVDASEIDETADLILPARFEQAFETDLPVVVGLERCDYTKGIPERLRAIAQAHRMGARFSYLGVAAPTRQAVPAYRALDAAVQAAADEAAASAQEAGLPFRQVIESTDWPAVVSLLRRADVVLTSSLADGMNLVPIQAILAQSARPRAQRAVAFTGAHAGVADFAASRDGLIAIHPFERDEFACTLAAAVSGKQPRISDSLVAQVRKRDARAWASTFLESLADVPGGTR